jgi:transposase
VVPSDEGPHEQVSDAPRASSRGSDPQKKPVCATEQQREAVVARRAEFERDLEEVDAEQLIFIYESGCNIAMKPARAWAPQGERAMAHRPMNWGDNITLIGAVRTTGLVALRPMRGAMKTLDFLDFVTRDLIPNLRERDVVVMDNLQQHRDPSVRLMIENAGARVVYLPPYSPELNPIGPYWSAFKKHLRRLEARTVDAFLRSNRPRSQAAHQHAPHVRRCGYE